MYSEMTINNRFSLLLAEKRIREKRNISIAEVARDSGISRKTLLAWANNTVTRYDAPVLDALCRYFGVEPGSLLEYVDEREI